MKYNPIKYWWYRTTNYSVMRLCEFVGFAVTFTLIDYGLVENITFLESAVIGLQFSLLLVICFSTIRAVLSVTLCLLATYDKRPYAGWVQYYNKEVRGR